MDFLIIVETRDIGKIDFNTVLDIGTIDKPGIHYTKFAHLAYHYNHDQTGKRLIFGDVIGGKSSKVGECKGIYYSVQLSSNKIVVQADRFGILPVFYSIKGGRVIVSSDYKVVYNMLDEHIIDDQFYIQMASFYTPIGKSTTHLEINRLEFGLILEISIDGIKTIKTRSFCDYLSSNPISFKDGIKDVVDCFIANSRCYFEDSNAIALTGGYDGRSIVACAHHFNQKFYTFSYGKRGSLDVEVPLEIAEKLGIDYRFLHLDDEYVRNEYCDCAMEYIRRSGGLNGFLYPQSLYYVKVLSSDFSNIITGYVGSEIIRSSKEPDCEVVPPVVFYYLSGEIEKAHQWLLDRAHNLKQIQLLPENYCPDDTLNIIDGWCKTLPNGLTANHKLFTYLYECCFMNLFGTWVHNGMRYAKIRVPFLDIDFFSQISKTQVSAFYLDFPEKNMRKRLKSCSFYTYLYNQAWPELGRIPISKGYSPNQLIRPFSSLSIALAYAKARRMKDPNGLDKLGSVSGAIAFLDDLNNDYGVDRDLLDSIRKNVLGDSYNRSHGFMALTKFVARKKVFK